jgi:hypothetical protein
VCVAATVVLFLCALPFSYLLLTCLSPPAVQVLIVMWRVVLLVLLCLYHLLRDAPRSYEVRRFLWVVVP